jgi:hypothetical protein
MERNPMAQNSTRQVVTAALTGTGSAANLFGAAAGYLDITTLIITSSTTTAQATLSDGTVSYIFNVASGSPVVANFTPPLKATSAATAWTLNAPNTMNAVAIALAVTN